MPNNKNDTTLTVAEIAVIFASERGSQSRLARLTKKDKTAISHWLHGRYVSAGIHRVAARIAKHILKKQNPGGTHVAQSERVTKRTNKSKAAPQDASVREGTSRVPVSARVA